MQIIPLKNDFPLGFYEALARVVVSFGRLEYLIKLCVKTLSAEAFTKGMAEAESKRQFADLCKTAKLRAQEKLNDSTKAERFSELIRQAEDLAEFRHSAVHALWTSHTNGLVMRISPKWDKSKRAVDWSRSHVVSVCELQQTWENIEDLYLALDA
ncbi:MULTISPECIES: hypothetical protein [unclassified Caballeronia]|uniref:hypothetical protein n=1 Tax=unclassified Caballeronia TaxID=2646786 RepID=UPI002028E023|nr:MULTISPECIES: hypothetical protein [unclassified Caballeronia]